MSFSFIGTPPSSKSLTNRSLVVKSFFPELKIIENSTAQDVILMKKAIDDFSLIDCGFAGTVLRFMALRVSREEGEFTLKGAPRLFERPHKELLRTLKQLGVQARFSDNSLKISSPGWNLRGDSLSIDMSLSSQFASAVLLSSWQLPFTLHIALEGESVSRGYLNMTIKLLRKLGMEIDDSKEREIIVSKNQKLKENIYHVEYDSSSAFSLMALSLVTKDSKVILKPFLEKSIQPDSVFPLVLKDMGLDLDFKNGSLSVSRKSDLKGVFWNLSDYPDLFPVLVVLCSLSKDESLLYGAPQLKDKESNRIGKSEEFLEKIGRAFERRDDGIRILKTSKPVFDKNEKFSFDSDQDHRMAMAMMIAERAGYPVELKNKEVVSKSFPEFLKFYLGK